MNSSRLNHITVTTDNSPNKLLIICVKYVIKSDLNIRKVLIPKEISDLLIDVYRETHLNADLKPESFTKFVSQFRSSNSRISRANFSDMPINDETLQLFLEEHSKTIKHLNISNCSHLTSLALQHINTIITRLSDARKMIRTVKVTEERPEEESRVVYTKKYANGIITTTTQNCSVAENVGIITDDYLLTQAMGVFDDYDFVPFQSIKLRELNGVKQSDFDNNSNKVSPIPSLIDVENFKPREVYSANTSDNTIKTVEIKTWQNSPIHTLIIGRSSHILPLYIEEDGLNDEEFSNNSYLFDPLLPLRKLVIHEWNSIDSASLYLKSIISTQLKTSLQYLDLSYCSSIGNGAPLTQLKSLKILILYNCPKLHLAIHSIIQIQTLRCLDISTSNDVYGHGYKHVIKQLTSIVTNLPYLKRLDISGTNLCGQHCDFIPGLESRHTKYLDYLGLYNTANEAAHRRNIPAISIAGNANEAQILTACEAYIDRDEFLIQTLYDLYHCFSNEANIHDVNLALDIVLLAMSKHLQEKNIQIAASASLFFIVKSDEDKHNFNIKVKRLIISRLLDAMQTHRYDTTILQNGCLTLYHFEIPRDVIFEYSRLVEILLHIVTNDDDYIQSLVGDLGAIDKMLSLIDSRLQLNVCDDVMEKAWIIMLDVTDTTPVNCERFLDNNGMHYFVSCLHSFPHREELLGNMLCLIGNVAICDCLRHRLMIDDYIQRFIELLDCESDGIEVSYRAAEILSHIAYDGQQVWQQYFPFFCKREHMLSRMREAISRWKINSKLHINYGSFEPILRFLCSDEVPSEAQYWVVWTLANLTRVKCSKHCPLLDEDNGMEILEKLVDSVNTPQHIRHLARLTIFQCLKYKKDGDLGGLEDSEDIDLTSFV